MSCFRRLLVLSCVTAFAFALAGSAPTARSRSSAAPGLLPGALVVIPASARPGKSAGLDLTIRSSPDASAPARVVVYAPAGYRLRTSGRPGTLVGDAGAVFLKKARSSALAYVPGRIQWGDPAKLSSDSRARACAPGRHQAVWIVTFKIKQRTVAIRFYVDRTRRAETSLGAFRLIACLASPYVHARPGAVHFLELHLELVQGRRSVFTNPVTAGAYTWRMLVTPYYKGRGTANPAATFEARTRVQQPHTLTLHARYLRKTRTLLLSGRLLALGQPRPGIVVKLYGGVRTGIFNYGHVTTSADGGYSLRKRVPMRRRSRVLDVGVSVDEVRGPCVAPSVAVAGCVDENLSPPPFVAVAVKIPSLGRS